MTRVRQQRLLLFIVAGSCLFVMGWAASRRLVKRKASAPHTIGEQPARSQARAEIQTPAAPDPDPITAHVIAGGGGSSTGGSLKIEGTIGEAGASRAMSGGSMTLRGGFWNVLGNAADTSPSATVTVSPGTVSAGGPDLIYTFTRFGSSAGTLTVGFSVGGTASLGTHYSQTGATSFNSTSGTVAIAAATTSASITVHPIPGSTSELNRTIILTVTAGVGYNLDYPNVAIGTIAYDDTPVVIPSIVVTEENTNNTTALNSVTFLRAPFRVVDDHNFSNDHVTRVILFTSYLGMSQPSPSLSVRAGGFDLPIENVGPILIGNVHASYIVVRLPQNLPPGDLLLTVTIGNITSSPTVLNIAP